MTIAPITIIGGSGTAGVPLLTEFVRSGIPTRVLAHQPENVRARFPTISVVAGSMARGDDVQRAIAGSSTVVLLTPLGGNNDVQLELDAAEHLCAAAVAERTPHVIYTSLLSAGQPTGVPSMDVKGRIEQMLATSGVGWTSLRAGAYLDYFVGRGSRLWRYGLVPAFGTRGVRTQYSAQRDLAQVIAKLHGEEKVVNGSIDVVDPMAYTAQDLARCIGRVLRRSLRIVPGPFAAPLIRLLLPPVRWLRPKQATVLTVMGYLGTHDFLGQGTPVATVLPHLRITTLEDYVRLLLAKDDSTLKEARRTAAR